MNNAVDKVSTLIEYPYDKDSNIQDHLMSLNTGIYKRGDSPSTTRRQKNRYHCSKICPCHVGGCNFGGCAK